ncbi:hypothetical protein [Haladaptatus caseinilyticus]|uniref:hypothetical protein n=1 Tax=Haladaptatus caseinilyticus TaxID=2993314 RepID=UPI00224AF2CE|nr:hypothetical protein [Haladaptatus caseinilyticus]
MSESRDNLLQNLNEKLAVESTPPENREIIGTLCSTIQTLGKEIDMLEEQLTEVQERLEEVEDTNQEQEKRAWYSER